MNRIHLPREFPIRNFLRWMVLSLVLTSFVGCQSLMKGKSKAKDPFAQDKFSCGEPLPGRSH